jgi:hypothetical protein
MSHLKKLEELVLEDNDISHTWKLTQKLSYRNKVCGMGSGLK